MSNVTRSAIDAAGLEPAATANDNDNDISKPNVPAPAAPNRLTRTQIKTVRLDAKDFRPSWPIAIASLEQLSGWAVLALRLGTLALINQCVRELAEPNARADAVGRLRALTDALAHMPLEA